MYDLIKGSERTWHRQNTYCTPVWRSLHISQVKTSKFVYFDLSEQVWKANCSWVLQATPSWLLRNSIAVVYYNTYPHCIGSSPLCNMIPVIAKESSGRLWQCEYSQVYTCIPEGLRSKHLHFTPLHIVQNLFPYNIAQDRPKLQVQRFTLQKTVWHSGTDLVDGMVRFKL